METTTGLERFMAVYIVCLERAVVKYPADYPWYPHTPVLVVVERMRLAIIRGSFNKDGHAFRWTCKELGIAYTYAAIKTFIKE